MDYKKELDKKIDERTSLIQSKIKDGVFIGGTDDIWLEKLNHLNIEIIDLESKIVD